MNILQALPRLNVGGVETGTVDLAKYLVGHGHRCVVVSAGGELVPELEAYGSKHYQLPLHSKFFPVMVKASRALAEIIRREDIQIVHARSRVPAWVGFMACRQTRATFLTTAHGHYSRHIFSTIMGWGKYTIVPSTVIGKHMMENFGVPLENIRLIPRSVDLERYLFQLPKGQAKTQFTVGVIGRITPIKGQLYFLKALARVLRSMPYVNAWIVGGVSPGKDHYKEELEVWMRRLGLTHAVKFLGNRRDIPQILRQLDCLVMPSIAEEAFGRVIVEAQASGVPVIATNVGGVSEIIDDGQDGLLVFPKDHEVLADAILKILKDPPLARQLAQAGRRKVEEKFSLTKMAEDTVAVYSEALAQPRILVIKISAVGDAVLAVPSFAAIKKKFPSAHVVCLVGREAKDVFQRCPYIDGLVVCDFSNKDRGLRGMFRLAKKLLRRRFDLVIDLQNNRKSHLLSYLTCSPQRYGYDNGKFGFLLNHRVKDTKEPISPVEHQFQVLKMLGITQEPQALELWPSAEDERFACDFLKECWLGKERLIGINIGASPRWNTKRWRAKRFAKLCDALAKKDYRVLVTGSSADAAFAKEILDQTKTNPVCAVAQTTLLQLASLVRHCDCFVTGDSAPLHIAAAMKTPVVAFFGPTDPRRHMPKGVRGLALRKDCVPCYSGVCPKKTNACMESITAEEVLKAIEELLVHHKDCA